MANRPETIDTAILLFAGRLREALSSLLPGDDWTIAVTEEYGQGRVIEGWDILITHRSSIPRVSLRAKEPLERAHSFVRDWKALAEVLAYRARRRVEVRS